MLNLTVIYDKVIRRSLIPLILIISTTNLSVILPYIVLYKKNELVKTFLEKNIFSLSKDAWNKVNLYDYPIWLFIFFILICGMLSILYLPGKKYLGPYTNSGFQPKYRNTSILFYLISMTFYVLIIINFDMADIFLRLLNFSGILTIFGLIFTIIIYLKGLYLPSAGLFIISDNPLFDYYWGIELYPRFGKYLDIKQLINSRFGIWLWQLIILISWKAHHDFYKLSFIKNSINESFNYRLTANVLLQTIYIFKFYIWESGYMHTIDITLDHFGFYLGWGCIAWVPIFFTLNAACAVHHWPINDYYNFTCFILNILFGLIFTLLEYEADRERQLVRNTDGQCKIWFKNPKLIYANYTDEDGVKHRSLLLASGFWGQARHINYLFEALVAFSWCFATGNNGLIAYLYFIFIIILLIHRSQRDEEKCKNKYKKFWLQYCQIVPYKIIPYIY